MKSITITLGFEDATILAYAKRRGFVEGFVKDTEGNDTEVALDPMDFLKEYWKQYIVTNINEYIEDEVWSQAQVQANALKADALTKIAIS